jgi:hypothetical protein
MSNNLTARSQKIQALEAKLAELREAERLATARKKSAASRAERAAATRRKILLGAFLLDQLPTFTDAADFVIGSRKFAGWLVRDSDRALFGLPALAHPASEPASARAPSAGVSQ